MAKSSAKKKLEKQVKQGKFDPRLMRGNWGVIDPSTKVKPNKKKHDRRGRLVDGDWHVKGA